MSDYTINLEAGFVGCSGLTINNIHTRDKVFAGIFKRMAHKYKIKISTREQKESSSLKAEKQKSYAKN
ncbi:MAG: hypothetical protein WAS94_01105 [Candidatus Saccharimonadales bacterium]